MKGLPDPVASQVEYPFEHSSICLSIASWHHQNTCASRESMLGSIASLPYTPEACCPVSSTAFFKIRERIRVQLATLCATHAGGGITEMRDPEHGPAFRLGTGSTSRFSNVAFSSMQMTRSVVVDGYTDGNSSRVGPYGPLGLLSAAAAVFLEHCQFTNISVKVCTQALSQ